MLGTSDVAQAADPWLFVNDVHLDPFSHNRRPSESGRDTNLALLASALAEMRRVAPNPPVIVMAGDFLGHHFRRSDATPTMVELARRFDAVFPHAQFVIALGNEDSDCGDYGIAPNSAFLRVVTKAWAPLVNRHGAAPDFERTFPRDGFYTARLPIPGVRAVVVDDAFWSPVYHNGCGRGDPTPGTVAELVAALSPNLAERRWLVMHIPPGTDVSSTMRLTRHLAIVPFLRPDPREALISSISDPARHVELVVTGHIHRFGYRIVAAESAAPIPVLVSPAISPIYGNASSFLTADVAPDGRIRNLEEHSRVDGRWRDIGGLRDLGVSEFSGSALVGFHRRLAHSANLRAAYFRLYVGGVSLRDMDESNWRSYWCAATEFTATGFRDCLDEGGFSFLTRRGVLVVGAAIGGVVVVVGGLAAVVVYTIRRRRPAGRA